MIDSASTVCSEILVLLFPKEIVDNENIVSIFSRLPIAVQSNGATLDRFVSAS